MHLIVSKSNHAHVFASVSLSAYVPGVYLESYHCGLRPLHMPPAVRTGALPLHPSTQTAKNTHNVHLDVVTNVYICIMGMKTMVIWGFHFFIYFFVSV